MKSSAVVLHLSLGVLLGFSVAAMPEARASSNKGLGTKVNGVKEAAAIRGGAGSAMVRARVEPVSPLRDFDPGAVSLPNRQSQNLFWGHFSAGVLH